jgi:hypothetical protein
MSSSTASSSLTPTEQTPTEQTPTEQTPTEQMSTEQTPNTRPAGPHTWPGNPNGLGIVRDGYIYSILLDSPLMTEYGKLTSKEERCKFMLDHGKKQGPVLWDTRRQPLRDVPEHGGKTSQ